MNVELPVMAIGGGTDRRGGAEVTSRDARHAALDELTRESGVVRVRGMSMMPTLSETAWVRFTERSPWIGDVVVYRRAGGDLVVHRFLGRRPAWRRSGPSKNPDPWIVTKPDAATEFDVETRLSAVLGTVEEFRDGPTAPWQRLKVSPWQRACSVLWFVRYWLWRARRRLLR